MGTRIVADVLVPGRGEPVDRGTVLLDDGVVTWVGATADAPAASPDEDVHEVAAVLPGLWDCHAHFLGLSRPNIELVATTHPVTAVARATADVAATLRGGITSVREVGGHGLWLAPAVEDGRIPGPRIHAAGRILSTTGGHGDIHAFPLDVVHALEPASGLSVLADGVPEVLRAVRSNLRSGASVIKVCASGGVMSEVDHPEHQQFSEEELAAIVAEAGRAERVVAAHCHGKAGIMAALRAGCHTIEHGSHLDEEAADLMVEQGAILVPTRFVVDELLGQVDELPRYAYEKGQAIADAHAQALELAIAKGVRIATGCDIFVSGPVYGRSSREVRHLVDAGMTDLEAIAAATADAPATLGPQAPRSGQLAPGFDADVVALDTNPFDDRSVWGEPDRVTHVWQGGRRVV
jgi:imidazolonepropionase-like amidohydrolase